MRRRSQGKNHLAHLTLLIALTAAQASAGTITVEGTLAVAGPNEDPFFATYDNSSAVATNKAVADVASGHLGARF